MKKYSLVKVFQCVLFLQTVVVVKQTVLIPTPIHNISCSYVFSDERTEYHMRLVHNKYGFHVYYCHLVSKDSHYICVC